MIVSEIEARRCACPFAKDFVASAKDTQNAAGYNPGCIGSRCMAWTRSPFASDSDPEAGGPRYTCGLMRNNL